MGHSIYECFYTQFCTWSSQNQKIDHIWGKASQHVSKIRWNFYSSFHFFLMATPKAYRISLARDGIPASAVIYAPAVTTLGPKPTTPQPQPKPLKRQHQILNQRHLSRNSSCLHFYLYNLNAFPFYHKHYL